MALELWKTEEIANILRAVAAASNAAGGSPEYRGGHAAALYAVALALGCKQDPRATPRGAGPAICEPVRRREG